MNLIQDNKRIVLYLEIKKRGVPHRGEKKLSYSKKNKEKMSLLLCKTQRLQEISKLHYYSII